VVAGFAKQQEEQDREEAGMWTAKLFPVVRGLPSGRNDLTAVKRFLRVVLRGKLLEFVSFFCGNLEFASWRLLVESVFVCKHRDLLSWTLVSAKHSFRQHFLKNGRGEIFFLTGIWNMWSGCWCYRENLVKQARTPAGTCRVSERTGGYRKPAASLVLIQVLQLWLLAVCSSH